MSNQIHANEYLPHSSHQRVDETTRSRVKQHGTRRVAMIAFVGLLVASIAAAGPGATEADLVVDQAVSLLGKPSQGGDGAAGNGLTMELVRQFEAEPMATLGYTGQGIDVAVIDTGVTPVQGLDAPGKVLFGPDLSEEGASRALATRDSYGHGTHIAGIIAGNDGLGSNGFQGMAPDARIVSLKVAGATGDTHIAQVIAAIDWVVEYGNTGGLNIRVLNLALGVDDVSSNLEDPLSAAVERAWATGIVVVAAAGNRGNNTDGLDSPSVSPYVIATGALNGRAVRDGVADWSSGGNANRHPDLVAPGKSILSLSVPGSTLEIEFPEAIIDGRYMRGSGTSQAAAVMSGSVALLLSAHPSLTPDQVKYLLVQSANDVERRSTNLDGAGKVRPDTAAENAGNAANAPVQTYEPALGISSWVGVDSWTGGEWSGATWSGATWSGATWSGATWSGATWSGATWSGATWSGATWSGATWSGDWWSSAEWSNMLFSGSTWS